MHLEAVTGVPASPGRAWADLADLAGYPQWLSIVLAADRAEPHPDDPGPAWDVDLGAHIGPFTRSKRVRMARTVADPPRRVRFERLEHDGGNHSAWVLDVTVAASGKGSEVAVTLDHSGLDVPFLEPLLREEARRAGRRLATRLSASPAGPPGPAK